MEVVQYKIKANTEKKYIIVLLSDLHSNPCFGLIDILEREVIDIIAISGDFVDTSLRN